MSDIFAYGLPTGRRLDGPSAAPGHIGTVGVLRPHTAKLGKILRRNLRELDGDKFEHAGRVLTHTPSGEQFTVVTTLVDPSDPHASGVGAFAVIDGFTVYLAPLGTVREPEKSVHVGEIGAYQVPTR